MIFVAIMNRIHSIRLQPDKDTSMGTMTSEHVSQGDLQQWKTQECHGKQIHVCTVRRIHQDEDLPGRGQQWDFKVRITDGGSGSAAHEFASAESGPKAFYSTQAVTEDLGYTRHRELVEGMWHMA